MAGFIRLFCIQSPIMFWCSLIMNRSETRHMLIAQTVWAQAMPELLKLNSVGWNSC